MFREHVTRDGHRWLRASALRYRRFSRALAIAALFTCLAPGMSRAQEYGTLWTHLSPPSVRFDHTLGYDPQDQTAMLIAGYDSNYTRDLWVLQLSGIPAWSRPSTATAPSPAGRRSGHTSVLFPPAMLYVVIGGLGPNPENGGYLNEVVYLATNYSGPSWSLQLPSGTPPAPRAQHTAILDTPRNRIVVFGGEGQNGVRFNDVWSFNPLTNGGSGTWTKLNPVGTAPPPMSRHVAVYDPAGERMIVYGGTSSGQLWALSLAGTPAWSALTPTNAGPTAYRDGVGLIDEGTGQLVYFGGRGSGPAANTETWVCDLATSPTWTQLQPGGTPPAKGGGTAGAFLASRRCLLINGGDEPGADNGTYALNLGGSPHWEVVVPPAALPKRGQRHVSVFDPLRNRILLLASNGLFSVSSYSFALGGAWASLASLGDVPDGIQSFSVVYDAPRDCLYLFGGVRDASSGVAHNTQTYVGRFGSGTIEWTILTLQEVLPPAELARTLHSAIFDVGHDRMLVYGGKSPGNTPLGDIWALNLSSLPTWVRLTAFATAPGSRYGHSAVYQHSTSHGNLMTIFGGTNSDGLVASTWALLLDHPSEAYLGVSQPGPPAREYHTAVTTSSRDTMLVFGGWPIFDTDVWALTFGPATPWTNLGGSGSFPPPSRYLHTAIGPAGGHMMTVFGGFATFPSWPLGNFGQEADDLFALYAAPGPAGVEPPMPAGTPTGRVAAHPLPALTRVSLVIQVDETESAARLRICDVHGRVVRTFFLQSPEQGLHNVDWDLRDDAGNRVAAGVYYAAYGGSRTHKTGKIVVLR